MKKVYGIMLFFLFVVVATALMSEAFLSSYNLENLVRRTALFGIISVGVSFVIISGGIDLSIGSVICLIGCGLPWMLVERQWPLWVALLVVLFVSAAIGLFHGILITKLKLQPFVVTLCGLLLYRGLTRALTADQTQGFKNGFSGLRTLATGEIAIEHMLVVLGLLLPVAMLLSRVVFLKIGTPKIYAAGGITACVFLVLGLTLKQPQSKIHSIEQTGRQTSVQVQIPEGVSAISIYSLDEEIWKKRATRNTRRSKQGRITFVVNGLYGKTSLLAESDPVFSVPMPWLILFVVVVISVIFLNETIYGRYLLALGNNEEAAQYSGIKTDRMIILAYLICSLLSGLGGMLFVLDVNSAQPSDFGNFYELYAIAAAVLGGCSLRGGEGSILGVLFGTALMQTLRNMIVLVDWIPTHIEYAVIGLVILCGVAVDELMKKLVDRKRITGKQLVESQDRSAAGI